MVRVQFRDRGRDDRRFLRAERAGFAGVRIQSSDGDARCAAETATQKIERASRRRARSLLATRMSATRRERDMRGDERHAERAAGEEHGEIFHAATCGEEFGLAGKLRSRSRTCAPCESDR